MADSAKSKNESAESDSYQEHDLQLQSDDEHQAITKTSQLNEDECQVITKESQLLDPENDDYQVIRKKSQLESESDEEQNTSDGEVGYDVKLVDGKLPEGVEVCPICKLIPRKPTRVSCCKDYPFCRSCISRLNGHPCPLCRKKISQTKFDKKAERQIMSLKVRCKNCSKGCKWTGELRELEEHLKAEPNKGGKIAGCEYQITSCKKCDEDMMYTELADHMKSTCEKRTVDCDYKYARCDFKGPKINMPNHNKDNITDHLFLLAQFANENQKRQQQVIERQQQAITVVGIATVSFFLITVIMMLYLYTSPNSMETCMNGLESQLQSHSEHLRNQEMILERLESQLQDHSEHLKNQETVLERLDPQLQSHSEHLKNQEARLDSQLQELSEHRKNSEVLIEGLDSKLQDLSKHLKSRETLVNTQLKKLSVDLDVKEKRIEKNEELVSMILGKNYEHLERFKSIEDEIDKIKHTISDSTIYNIVNYIICSTFPKRITGYLDSC